MTGWKIASPLGAIDRVGLVRPGPPTGRPLWRVPRDSAIPHLASALDAVTMRRVFQTTTFATGVPGARPIEWRVQWCAIEWIKYRPGKNCTVAYRVGLHDRSNPRSSSCACGCFQPAARTPSSGRSTWRIPCVRSPDARSLICPRWT